jgi:5-methylthioadenosine/S-adenosylhomocysteine deaminase
MCRLCDPKKPQLPCPTRRDFLTASAIGGAAATLGLGSTRTAQAQTVAASTLPEGLGTPGRRVLIKGGAVLSVDDAVGNFAVGDVLIDGKTIVEVGPNIDAPDAVSDRCSRQDRDAGFHRHPPPPVRNRAAQPACATAF